MKIIDTNVERSHLSRILSMWNRISQTLIAFDELRSGKNHFRGHANENIEADMIDLFKHELGHRRQSFLFRSQAGISLCVTIGSFCILTGIVSGPGG
jgi:hypothetical protein